MDSRRRKYSRQGCRSILRCFSVFVIVFCWEVYTALASLNQRGRATTCDKELEAGLPPFYQVFKVEDSEIQIDGKLSERVWSQAPSVEDFTSIYGKDFEEEFPEEAPWKLTSAKILWSEQYLYVSATLEEDKIWATDYGWRLPTEPLSPLNPRPPCDKESSRKLFPTCPFRNGDFEFFISPSADGQGYKEFEFNANVETRWNHGLGPAVMTLSFPRAYHDLHDKVELWLNNETNRDLARFAYSVTAEAPINSPSPCKRNSSWSVEAKVPIQYLLRNTTGEYPRDGIMWRHAFSRVQYHLRESRRSLGNYEPYHKTLIEMKQGHLDRNFVWPATYMYDIHMPDMWGVIVFSSNRPGELQQKDGFRSHPFKKKWRIFGTLSRIYHAQWAYQVDNGRTTFEIDDIRTSYSILSNKTLQSDFKKLKQVYAFYSVKERVWSEHCLEIKLVPDAQTGWKAWVKEPSIKSLWWTIDGWRRIESFASFPESSTNQFLSYRTDQIFERTLG